MASSGSPAPRCSPAWLGWLLRAPVIALYTTVQHINERVLALVSWVDRAVLPLIARYPILASST